MSQAVELLTGNQYITEMLIACLLVMHPHRKKKQFWPRTAAFCLAAELVSLLVMNSALGKDIWQSPAHVMLSCVIFVIIFPAVAITFLRLCCPMSGWMELVYCSALCQCIQHFAAAMQLCISAMLSGSGMIVETAVWVLSKGILYVIFYGLVIRRICVNGFYEVNIAHLTADTLFVVLIAAFISVIAKGLQAQEDSVLFYVCQVYDMVCCGFLLRIQVSQRNALQLQQEVDIQNYLRHLRHEQFRQSKGDMDLLIHLMHELTHQVVDVISEDDHGRRDELLSQIEENLLVFHQPFHTKNETLDTALLERSLFCRANHISWMVVADGEKLDFMDTEDIYLMFRNALNNAIEGVCTLEEMESRIIDVRVFTQMGCLMIQVENDFADRLQLEEEDDHGFELKTIQQVVERYGGCMTAQAKDHRFTLHIVIPLPK